MTRVGSQLTFCSPQRILRRTVVEKDEQNIITRFFSLDDGNAESEQTLFFDGIISAGIISIKQNIPVLNPENFISNYNYFDLSENLSVSEIIPTDKPLVLGFGTVTTNEINKLLPQFTLALKAFSIYEIIAAYTFYPALMLGQKAGLVENMHTRLLLWENADLVNKCLTFSTKIRDVS